MHCLENDQLHNGKPIYGNRIIYQAQQGTHKHKTVKNAFPIYLLDLKEPFTVDAVYLMGCSAQTLSLSITDTHLSL
jgi:hypothetical protein